MKGARFAQLGAVALALVLVLSAGGYGITRGFLTDDPPPSWGRLEIIDAALDYVRAEPCNHPDASTVKARLTTVGQALEIIHKSFGDPYVPEAGQTEASDPSTERSVWLVELSGKIPVLGIRRDPDACGPSPKRTLAFYFVDLNGKVDTAYGSSDWDGR
jgi:hypothetical protein